MFFRKHFLPWTAGALFETEEAFQHWLRKRQKTFSDLRALCLVLAAVCLIAGYVIDRRPLMLLTIAPLALVLLLSVALERTEALLDGQNNTHT